MGPLVIATGNAGKLREIAHACSDLPFEVVSQNAYHVPPVAETGQTFIENALIKARHAVSYCDGPVLADDSGLVVPALGGQPGVLSARYAGPGASDQDNNEKLLQAMSGFSGKDRRAYFVCVITVVRYIDDPYPLIAQARWEGRILMQSQGEAGFGYDPIFLPDNGADRAAAELSISEKQALSHRGQAIALLKAQLPFL